MNSDLHWVIIAPNYHSGVDFAISAIDYHFSDFGSTLSTGLTSNLSGYSILREVLEVLGNSMGLENLCRSQVWVSGGTGTHIKFKTQVPTAG